ncbi:MAG: hypothetical protein IJV15_10630 [Lachnospiraceae bacterium]|nr:hypothetical protein [Lachnospiraceae bacterium]
MLIIIIVCFLGQMLISIINKGSLTYGVYNLGDITRKNICLIYLTTIFGIAFWTIISRVLFSVLGRSRLINYTGKHTYAIMLNHLGALFLIQGVIALLSRADIAFKTFDLNGYKSWVYYMYVPYYQIRLLYVIGSIAIVLLGCYSFDKVTCKIKKLVGR